MTKIWRKNSAEALWLQANYKGRWPKDLAAEMTQRFGYAIPPSRVSHYLYHLGLKTGVGAPLLSKEQYQWLKDHCHGLSYEDQQKQILEQFGVYMTLDQVKNMRNRYKMNSGLTGQFKKGNVPWNKGMKGCCTGGRSTQFRPGHMPHNTRPENYESVDIDGYVHIKPPGEKYMILKHRWIWEQAYGPIPPGYCLIFLDRNKQNCSLNNLALITRAEHARMCQKHLQFDNPEYTKAGIQIAKLMLKKSEQSKKRRRRK
ncbi:HNH endonuclease signature motif containing protein [Megasphaera sp. UBA4382]|uniref:HNH endonuclease signature motif containing protein n=1 Tax=Megasphaera sp. UBA4382 TaxID=1946850 RepID=UPI0025C5E785|nr:HNH endonuclease signature motif containing protein [Megasphaera sp. UBA4382]